MSGVLLDWTATAERSEADKAELALRIEKSAAHLRELATRGDNEAAGILQNFSDMVKKNKK